MYIKNLTLINFRNLVKSTHAFNPRYNFLTGANAQGKTNLLEAIYYLATARSFRVSKINNLVRVNKEYFYLKGITRKVNDDETLEVSFKQGEGRKHKYNHVLLKKGEYPWGVIPTLSFSRKDLKLSEEEATYRRRFLDQEISFLSKPYFSHLKRYSRCLKQRNSVLRDRSKSDENIRMWDKELVGHAIFIEQKRREFVELLNVLARLTYRQLTANTEELQIHYCSNRNFSSQADWENEYYDFLQQSLTRDKKFGYTTIGPHRDDFEIVVNNKDIRRFGSSGQHKSVVLSIKIALIEVVKKQTGHYPVLLLDEVFSELDKNHCDSLMSILKKKKLQVFFTSNDFPSHLKDHFRDKTTIFRVSDGVISQPDL